MAYPGPQPISPSPLAGVLDDDLLNTYNQLFPGGKPQKPQYQSSSLAGSYQNFLGTPSSSSGSGQNTDWIKYLENPNHGDLVDGYNRHVEEARAKGDLPKARWQWAKDHYKDFGQFESRDLTGLAPNLIEEAVNGVDSLGQSPFDIVYQSEENLQNIKYNAEAAINAASRESDDYKTDVLSFTDITGSLINLQGVREEQAGETQRQADRLELEKELKLAEFDNRLDVEDIIAAGNKAVQGLKNEGAVTVAGIEKEANDYAVNTEKTWREFIATQDKEARLGAAQLQKEGVIGSAQLQKEGLVESTGIKAGADIRVGELDAEARKFAAQAQKEAILGAENIKAKGALDLQPIINAGLADVARLNKEATLGAAEITGKYGVEEEKVRGMSAKDVAKIQSRGNVFGSLVSAFNF